MLSESEKAKGRTYSKASDTFQFKLTVVSYRDIISILKQSKFYILRI